MMRSRFLMFPAAVVLAAAPAQAADSPQQVLDDFRAHGYPSPLLALERLQQAAPTPDIRPLEAIRRTLQLAAYPNLHAKLTGLVDFSDVAYPFQDMYPLFRAVIDAYTPDRCVWTGGFSTAYSVPKGTYGHAFTLFTESLGLSEGDKEAILCTTPGKLWFGDG